jgi:hypothetical protein
MGIKKFRFSFKFRNLGVRKQNSFLIISSQFGGGKENAIWNDAVSIRSQILRNMHQVFLFELSLV